MTTASTIAYSQIETLRAEAAAHGDSKMVKTCDRALNGSSRAKSDCARAIREAEIAAAG